MTEHSARRKGKRVKTSRSINRTSIESLDELFAMFVEVKIAEGRASNTLKQYRENYSFFTKYLDEKNIPRQVKEITTGLIRSYIIYMQSEIVRFDGHKYKSEEEKTVGLSPSTINTRLKTLRALFKFLVAEGHVEVNPVLNVSNVTEPQDDIQILTAEELKALLNVPNQRNYSDFRNFCLMNVLIDGMTRISETLALKTSDIDFTANIITIRAEIAKSNKSRIIPIQKRTAKLLRELISENNADFDTEYIFVTNYGEQIDRNLFRKQLKVYGKRAGITKNIHPHLLRHSAATLFLESGGDISHLRLLLGHADLRIVLKYLHLSDKTLIEQHSQYSALNSVTGKLSKERKILR